MVSIQTLSILLFLIPGFIASAVMNVLTIKKPARELNHVVEALIFSVIVYTAYAPLFENLPIALNQQTMQISFNAPALGALLGFSIVIPIIISFLFFNDHIMKLARKLQITKKTANESPWNDAFNLPTTWITIHFKDGSRLTGWPRFFPDNPDNRYFYLENAAWVKEKNKKQILYPLDLQGVLITPEMPIEYIYFLKK